MQQRKDTEILLSKKGKLILTKELLDQIAYLHKEVGPIEWSGVLAYRKEEGEISDPESLVLKAEKIFLMDIGNATYTTANFDQDNVIEMWDEFGHDYTLKTGMIHTHHGMSTFFSVTDMAELHESAPLHNYYLSLIVNFAGTYTARVAWRAVSTTTVSFKDSNDQIVSSDRSENLLMQIEMEIVKEEEALNIPESFRNRHIKIKEEKAKKSHSYHGSGTYYGGNYINPGPSHGAASAYARNFNDGYDDEYPGYYVHPGTTEPSPRVSGPAGVQYEITKEGNVQAGGKVYKPYLAIQKEVKEKIIQTIKESFGIYDDLEPDPRMEQSLSAYMEHLENYFAAQPSVSAINFYLDTLTTRLYKTLSNRASTIVAREGIALMKPFDTSMAADLIAIFDAYPQYVREMEKIDKAEAAANQREQLENKLNERED